MARFYVLCDDDCRYEGMTKEEILAAIEQAIEQGYVSDPDGAVFSRIKEINANGTVQIWSGTEAEFNALSPTPTVGLSVVRVGADGVLYLCANDSLMQALSQLEVDSELSEESENAIANKAVTLALKGKAPDNHKHEASDVEAGKLGGKVQANQDAMAATDEAQVRDIVVMDTDPGEGVASVYPDGTVVFCP